jgi:purine-binding chemotaxis protein CheW
MDILSARKKAAERAQARKKTEVETAADVPALPEQQPREVTGTAPEQPSAGVAAGPAGSDVPVVEDAEAAKAPSPEGEAAATEAVAPLQEIEMLSFRLGDEEYAVMVDAVKEVLKIRDLTPVPNAPDYVLGVMALRGTVLPVIDLCRRLGLPPGKQDEKSRIIVVSVNDEDAGIHVDRVTGVVRISPDAVRPTPETIEHGAEFLRGIARKEDKLYILLDTEKAVGA